MRSGCSISFETSAPIHATQKCLAGEGYPQLGPGLRTVTVRAEGVVTGRAECATSRTPGANLRIGVEVAQLWANELAHLLEQEG